MRKLPVRKIANGGGKFPASAGRDGSNHVHPFRNQSEPRQGVIQTDGRRTIDQSGQGFQWDGVSSPQFPEYVQSFFDPDNFSLFNKPGYGISWLFVILQDGHELGVVKNITVNFRSYFFNSGHHFAMYVYFYWTYYANIKNDLDFYPAIIKILRIF